MATKIFKITETKKLPECVVEITAEITKEALETYKEKAFKKIKEVAELPGFRKGHVPDATLKEKMGELGIIEEASEMAIDDCAAEVILESKTNFLGRPEISISKIALNSPVEFKIKVTTMPDAKLPDYKKIAAEQNKKEEYKKEIIVEEEAVEKTILELRKMRAEQARPAHEHKEGESEEEHQKAHAEIKESDYPAFDDEFAKSFGSFKTADELKEKIKNNLKIEKETEQKDKLRLVIVEELVKQTKGEIPEILIQSETDKIMYRLQADITNAGFKMEDYLKQINKTEADLRNEWKADAEKRAKLQIIIHTISEKENLKPTEEEIEKDVAQITAMYKEADSSRARAYVEQMLENEKVFTFLEKQ